MNEIYNTLWQSIQAGGCQLAEMLRRIDVLYAAGQLSEEERSQLTEEARANADPAAEYPSDLRALYEALAARVDALEALHAEGGAAEEWPEYVQPTGSQDAYYSGDQITYNGVRYTCVAPEGFACTWPPDVYPGYWQAWETE